MYDIWQVTAAVLAIINSNNNNYQDAFQPGACGASLSSPGRLVLSNLIGARNRQMVNVRQDHIVPDFPRLANMPWTLDLAKQHALSQPVISFVYTNVHTT